MAITRAQQVRQMLKDGNFVMQGGVKNYLGKQKTVNNVPVKWQSGPDKPSTELAYITKAEKDLLLKKDIHGSLKDGPNTGPEGIMSLDSQGDKTKDRSPSGSRGPQTGPGGPKGKDRDDPPSNFRSSNVMNPENVRAGVNRNVRSLTDLQGGRIGGAGTDDDKSALKDTGTGKYRLVTSGDNLYDYNLTKDFVQGNLDYQDGKKPSGRDLRLAGASPLQIRNARYRANMIDRFVRTKRDRLLAELELAGIEGAEDLTDDQLKELFATGNLGSAVNLNDILADSSQAGIFDKSKIRYTKGGTFDPTSPIYGGPPQPYVGTGNPITDAIFGRFGKAASGPVTTQGLEKLYEQYKNLQGGFTTDLVDGEYQKGDQIDLATMNRDDLMKEFSPNAYAVEQGLLYNPRTGTFTKRNDDGPSQETDPCLGPNPPAYCNVGNDDDEDATDPRTNFYGLSPRIGGSMFDFSGLADGGRVAAMDGGIMDMAREEMFLGGIAKGIKKGLKSVTRGLKKVVKSPIGKAALLGAVGYGLGGGTFFGKMLPGVTRGGQGFGGFGGLSSIFGNVGDMIGGKGLGDAFAKFGGNKALTGILGASILPLLLGKKEEDEFDIDAYYAANKLNRNAQLYNRIAGSQFSFAEGGEVEPVAKKTMPLLDMGGQEMDLRAEGGFVPIGRMEKADDVPARLSKNEFVFTAEAVRNAGEGDVDKGAEVMYNMMKNLESGGEVSEESQGLEGAREMFKTSQRLGEVI